MALRLEEESDGRSLRLEGPPVPLMRVKAALLSRWDGLGFDGKAGAVVFRPPIGLRLEDLEFAAGAGMSASAQAAELLDRRATQAEQHRAAVLRAEAVLASPPESLGDPHWDRLLDAHQRVAAVACSMPGLLGACVFDEQGTGKTLTALAAADLLLGRNEIDQVFVVCPKILVANWEEEIARMWPRPAKVAKLEGNPLSRLNAALGRADFRLVNYEAVGGLLDILKGVLGGRALLIIDESHHVKNPDARRSEAVRELREACARCLVMCGTPAPNAPTDLVHQFDLADLGVTFGPRRVPEVEPDRTAFVRARVFEEGFFLRRLKSQVLPDLPEKQFIVHAVSLAGRQADLYTEARDQLVLYLRSLDNRSFRRNLADYLSRRTVLLQICSSPWTVDPTYSETPAKWAVVDHILGEVLDERSGKAVVWSFFTRSIDELEQRYARFGTARLDGTVSSGKERSRRLAAFRDDAGTKLFIGNPSAAGAGINLQNASESVYVSLSDRAADLMQSIDRTHRRGQEAAEVRYHFVVCKGTIEEAQLSRLLRKARGQGELLSDPEDEHRSLEAALAELGALV